MTVRPEHDEEVEGGTMGHAWSPALRVTACGTGTSGCRRSSRGRRAAAFDTRGEEPWSPKRPRASPPRLQRHGYEMVAEPEGSLIQGTPNC
jgi:hypothetical protein